MTERGDDTPAGRFMEAIIESADELFSGTLVHMWRLLSCQQTLVSSPCELPGARCVQN